ncbi:unnamed protein product [Caenorhabditis angaria]|uniref:CHK kinase-like domain-containing protein n=1 Tax=Caenorhabditis angaria TaxID=860376 RepID=A0A9P1I9W2_9PELO|nr:unnamed protein product [Caenorhabditis angaria]
MCIYRSPSCEYKDSLHLLNIISDHLGHNLDVYIVGDTNFPGIEWSTTPKSSNKIGTDFINFCDSHQLTQHIKVPTPIGEIIDRNRLEFAGGVDCFQSNILDFLDKKVSEKSFGLMRKSFPEEYLDQIDTLVDVSDFYLNKVDISKIIEVIGLKPVLTHSDLWQSNVMIVKNKLHAIIDWQTVSFGSPAQDIGLLIVSWLSTQDRRQKLDFLLNEYYNTFLDKIKGHPVPYTFEQLKRNYQLLFPVLACMMLPWIIQLSFYVQEKELREYGIEKCVGLMEDVLATHQKNLEDFPKFFEPQ